MPDKKRLYIYWDSCVFLSYIQKDASRVMSIEGIWEEISKNKESKIITSSVSILEVAFAAYEKTGGILDAKVADRLDKMWRDPSILLVEAAPFIMYRARDLMRETIASSRGEWSLKPLDAVHLATAQWTAGLHPISEFHTYDTALKKYANLLGGIPIVEPDATKPIQLPLATGEEETA
jgi:predicted nucleic acid-binding protein